MDAQVANFHHKRLNPQEMTTAERLLLASAHRLPEHANARPAKSGNAILDGFAGGGNVRVIRHLKSGGKMNIGIRLQQLRSIACRPQLVLAGTLGAFAADASARVIMSVPEPSLLSLIGAGAVAGIVAYRIRNKK